MTRITALFFLSLWMGISVASAQQFTGVEGSIYGGALNTQVQPALGVFMPYRWDVALAGVNAFWNNNVFSTSPLRWRQTGDSIDLRGHFITGNQKRWVKLQADVRLLNFLFRWPGRNDLVVGAGWNLHSISTADHLQYNYDDSMKTMSSFLEANALNRVQRGRIIDQQWSEWYITAAKLIRSDQRVRLAVGGSLKLVKGMSAFVIDGDGVSVEVQKNGQGSGDLVFTYASGRYGYSRNLEDFSNDQTGGEARQTAFDGSPLSPSLSFGISYLVKKPVLVAGFDADDPASYDWKLDASLTDIGRLKYPLGNQSMVVTGLKGQPGVDRVAGILDSVRNLQRFNDSVAALANIAPWQDDLSISLPTALRINLDKNLGRHFFVNARFVLDMSFLDLATDYKAKQTSYLMLTPRWEIKQLGVYAPLYVNTRGSLMAGAALRAGPLLVGVHDFGWLFHNTGTGGAYVAILIRGLLKGQDKYDCPVF